MFFVWLLFIPLTLVSCATHDHSWDYKQPKCDGLKEQNDWPDNGDSCLEFSNEQYFCSNGTTIGNTPNFSYSTAMTNSSWVKLRHNIQSSRQHYWIAFSSEGPLSSSTSKPWWWQEDSVPTSRPFNSETLIRIRDGEKTFERASSQVLPRRSVQAGPICSKNEYQNESNRTRCKPCPEGTITESEGATKISDCYQNCDLGYWCNFDTGLGPNGSFDHCCKPCAKGTFSNEEGTLQCQCCQDGMTTKSTGATTEEDCFWACGVGQEVDVLTGACKDCDQGKFKDSDQPGQCQKCIVGLTTYGKRSTSVSDCSILFCPPNTYVNPGGKGPIDPKTFKLADFCLPCEQGKLQPQYNSSSCDKCPDTPDMNNELPPSCWKENECDPEVENDCGEGMKCLKWTDYNYYHCVENVKDQQNDNSSLQTWQIILIAGGGCLGAAVLIILAVMVIKRCCGKKPIVEEATTNSTSIERRSTEDNYVSAVPDMETTSEENEIDED